MNQSFASRLIHVLVRFVLNPVTLFVVVLLTGLVGFALVTAVPEYKERLATAERLQPMSVAALGDSQPGSEVILEGRISPQSPAVYGSFVAYVREEYRTTDAFGNSVARWDEVARETPPLVVALPDGDVRIANNDYSFDTTATTLREAEPTLTKGAVQSRGYVAGDPVLVLGTVVDTNGSRAVKATFFYAGTRAAYLADYGRLSRTTLPIALPFLIVCAISTVALVWQIRRFMREAAVEQAAEEQRAAQQQTNRRVNKNVARGR